MAVGQLAEKFSNTEDHQCQRGGLRWLVALPCDDLGRQKEISRLRCGRGEVSYEDQSLFESAVNDKLGNLVIR